MSRDRQGALTTSCEAVTYKFIEPTPEKVDPKNKKLKKK
jgi:hypothetical protein